MEASARAPIAQACELIRGAPLAVAGSERWAAPIPVPEGLRALIDCEPVEWPCLDACRFDALCAVDGSGLQFLEIQAGDP